MEDALEINDTKSRGYAPTKNEGLNAVMAFWVAKTTMDRDGFTKFIAWADGRSNPGINGTHINRQVVKDLHAAFPSMPPDFGTVLARAKTITGPIGEWDPHVSPFKTINAVSQIES